MQVSSYCPLQLFSGDPERMETSLRSLLVTPQNNLAIFRDGVRLFGDAGSLSAVRCRWRECSQCVRSLTSNNTGTSF